MSERYNGYANYQTWNVCLWIDNEEGSYNYWQEAAQEAWDVADGEGRAEEATAALAERLENEIDDNREELGVPKLTGLYADLLRHALGSVDWREVAATRLEGIKSDE